jgi:hypothetical protein
MISLRVYCCLPSNLGATLKQNTEKTRLRQPITDEFR